MVHAVAAFVTHAAARPVTPVRHIVVIVQENRTVDNLFNGFPGADTVLIDPYTNTPLKPLSMTAPCGPGATHDVFVEEYDGGKMDGFDADGPNGCTYSFVPPEQTSRYRLLASNYVLADETFETNESDSYTAHQYLYAGRSCSYPSDVWCFADNASGAAYCGAKHASAPLINMTTPYPGKENRSGPPCKYYTRTIVSEATDAGLSWRYYNYDDASLWGGPASDGNCYLVKSCAANLIVPPRRVLHDIAAGRLADLVYVTPEPDKSDHPVSMRDPHAGENWVASVVNAIGASAYWPSTTILITWDDWGGWYDHVPPPQAPFYEDPFEYSFRVPLLVVSPYVQPRVDHTTRNVYGSMLRYVESTFGLPSLQQTDAPNLTDDLTALFDYAKPPRAFDPM